MHPPRIEVRRDDDGELTGFVEPSRDDDGQWRMLAVFGGLLGLAADRDAAEAEVRATGLAALAERWHFQPEDGGPWLGAKIIEAGPGRVVAHVGAFPGPVTREVIQGDAVDRLRLRV